MSKETENKYPLSNDNFTQMSMFSLLCPCHLSVSTLSRHYWSFKFSQRAIFISFSWNASNQLDWTYCLLSRISSHAKKLFTINHNKAMRKHLIVNYVINLYIGQKPFSKTSLILMDTTKYFGILEIFTWVVFNIKNTITWRSWKCLLLAKGNFVCFNGISIYYEW